MHNDSKLIFEAYLDKKQNIDGEYVKNPDGTSYVKPGGIDTRPVQMANYKQPTPPASTGAAALDLIKLIKAVRAGDQATIQQISNKYVPASNENSEGVAKYEELVARPEDKMGMAAFKYLANQAAKGDPEEDFRQAAQRWMRRNGKLLDVRNVLYFDRNGEPVFNKQTQGNFD